ncbi:hypothetical protein C5167_018350 [Papaver somniferum]|uniref:Uncharacterized protein n=1 Tax=Papaver somniferum TaxID=3469 RepID=A0A4Y7IQC9_PAPSO|nr:hypothetical protein C5167_018350 [Papaver somniferum]
MDVSGEKRIFEYVSCETKSRYLGGSAPLLGDVLVNAGTLLCALSNVGEVRSHFGEVRSNVCALSNVGEDEAHSHFNTVGMINLWKRSVCCTTWACQVSSVVSDPDGKITKNMKQEAKSVGIRLQISPWILQNTQLVY